MSTDLDTGKVRKCVLSIIEIPLTIRSGYIYRVKRSVSIHFVNTLGTTAFCRWFCARQYRIVRNTRLVRFSFTEYDINRYCCSARRNRRHSKWSFDGWRGWIIAFTRSAYNNSTKTSHRYRHRIMIIAIHNPVATRETRVPLDEFDSQRRATVQI